MRKKRFLPSLLVLAMILSMLPGPALAAVEPSSVASTTDNSTTVVLARLVDKTTESTYPTDQNPMNNLATSYEIGPVTKTGNDVTVELKAEGVVKHQTSTDAASAGYWVGIGIPKPTTGSSATIEQGWGTATAAGSLVDQHGGSDGKVWLKTADKTLEYADKNSDSNYTEYWTYYFDASAENLNRNNNVGYITVKESGATDTTTYRINFDVTRDNEIAGATPTTVKAAFVKEGEGLSAKVKDMLDLTNEQANSITETAGNLVVVTMDGLTPSAKYVLSMTKDGDNDKTELLTDHVITYPSNTRTLTAGASGKHYIYFSLDHMKSDDSGQVRDLGEGGTYNITVTPVKGGTGATAGTATISLCKDSEGEWTEEITVVPAPMADHPYAPGEPDKDVVTEGLGEVTVSESSTTGKTCTFTLKGTNIVEHTNADGDKGTWVGFGMPIEGNSGTGYTYTLKDADGDSSKDQVINSVPGRVYEKDGKYYNTIYFDVADEYIIEQKKGEEVVATYVVTVSITPKAGDPDPDPKPEPETTGPLTFQNLDDSITELAAGMDPAKLGSFDIKQGTGDEATKITVTGTANYVEWTGFNTEVPAEQKGHYLPIQIKGKTGQEITIINVSDGAQDPGKTMTFGTDGSFELGVWMDGDRTELANDNALKNGFTVTTGDVTYAVDFSKVLMVKVKGEGDNAKVDMTVTTDNIAVDTTESGETTTTITAETTSDVGKTTVTLLQTTVTALTSGDKEVASATIKTDAADVTLPAAALGKMKDASAEAKIVVEKKTKDTVTVPSTLPSGMTADTFKNAIQTAVDVSVVVNTAENKEVLSEKALSDAGALLKTTPITITVKVSDEDGTEVHILYLTTNKVERMTKKPLTVTDGVVTFQVPHLSTYAVVSEDAGKQVEESPNALGESEGGDEGETPIAQEIALSTNSISMKVDETKNVTVSGAVGDIYVVNADTLTTNGIVTATVSGKTVTITANKVGNADVTIRAKATGTYAVSTDATITVTVKKNDDTKPPETQPGTYKIDKDTAMTGGNVIVKVGGVEATSADAGAAVQLTVAQETNYTFKSGSLEVVYTTDPDVKIIPVQQDGSTTYTFTMPAADVTVKAVFEKNNSGDDNNNDDNNNNNNNNYHGSSSGGSSNTSKPEVVTKPDGTKVETVKNSDGSITVTETKPDGTKTVTNTKTVTKPDGTKVETIKVTETKPDGTRTTSSATVQTDKDGNVKADVKVTPVDGKATAPISPISVKDNDVEVKVSTGTTKTTKVEIPVKDVKPGMVAMLVKPDGTTEIIKTAIPSENGLVVPVSNSATFKIVDNSKPFQDMGQASWAQGAVDFVTARGMFAGTSETEFSPNTNLTRAMMMTVLARYEGVDTTGGATWYEKGMQWAMDKGVSDGTNPEAPINREQMVAMLWRYAGSPKASGDVSKFTDAAALSDWAREAMAWAIENGIISGMGDNTLAPQGTATRAQVASILQRFVTNVDAQA